MSHIKNIEIKNFKSIRHAKIEDCRRVNVFIGYPNVGKSNILEALSTVQIFNQKRFEDFHKFFRYENISEFFFEGNSIDAAEVTIDRTMTVSLSAFKNTAWPHVSAKDPEIRTKSGEVVHLKETGVNVYKYDFKGEINLKDIGTASLLQSPAGENLFQVIANDKQLRQSFNSLLESYNLKLLVDKSEAGIIRLKLQKQLNDDSIFQLPYIQIADTLKRLFFHKAAIATNKSAVLLFEEPEAHMFPPYISKFTGDVMFDENNNQFFITTHSPFVLNDFMEELREEDELAVYIVSYKKETGETLINRMTGEEMQEASQFGYDFFMNLENFIPQA